MKHEVRSEAFETFLLLNYMERNLSSVPQSHTSMHLWTEDSFPSMILGEGQYQQLP